MIDDSNVIVSVVIHYCQLLIMLLMFVEHNVAPVANAGVDKTVWLPVETVTLDGSNSTDDQKIDSYQWTCESYRFCFLFLVLTTKMLLFLSKLYCLSLALMVIQSHCIVNTVYQ